MQDAIQLHWTFRLLPEKKEKIREAAEVAGLTMSELVRQAADEMAEAILTAKRSLDAERGDQAQTPISSRRSSPRHLQVSRTRDDLTKRQPIEASIR